MLLLAAAAAGRLIGLDGWAKEALMPEFEYLFIVVRKSSEFKSNALCKAFK